jgi:hypothetical protein
LPGVSDPIAKDIMQVSHVGPVVDQEEAVQLYIQRNSSILYRWLGVFSDVIHPTPASGLLAARQPVCTVRGGIGVGVGWTLESVLFVLWSVGMVVHYARRTWLDQVR